MISACIFPELLVASLYGLHGQVFLEGTASVAKFIKYLFDNVSRCLSPSLAKLGNEKLTRIEPNTLPGSIVCW